MTIIFTLVTGFLVCAAIVGGLIVGEARLTDRARERFDDTGDFRE